MTDSTVLKEKDEKVSTPTSTNNEATTKSQGNDNSTEDTKPQTENKGNENKLADTSKESTEKDGKATASENGAEPNIELYKMTLDHILDVMSVPTHSKEEVRMVTYIILWARRNHVHYEFDDYGNVYLTKGKLAEGEYYPCVTAHMDTVHREHQPYIYANAPLPLKIEKVTKEGTSYHKLSVNCKSTSIGIGADDKGGICIGLGMFEHVDKLKACFFLDEETGCHGSENLNVDWFKNVGYVIGLDSPERYRAAWKCSGEQLFSYDFYEKCMKKVCDKYGLINCFYSEPFTDVKNIRIKTDIICMNFGNGGYNAHQSSEYCVIEEMDDVCAMCIDLVKEIGNTRHILSNKAPKEKKEIKKNPDGTYECTYINLDDTKKLEALGDNKRRTSYGGYSGGYTGSSYSSSSSSTPKKEDVIKHEVVKYIVHRYESQINGIKEDLETSIKALCEKLQVNYDNFKEVIDEAFNNEIKF